MIGINNSGCFMINDQLYGGMFLKQRSEALFGLCQSSDISLFAVSDIDSGSNDKGLVVDYYSFS